MADAGDYDRDWWRAPMADSLARKRARKRSGELLERVGLTDAAGRVTLTGLIAAPYTVVARRFGGGEARQSHVRPGAPLTLSLAR